MQQGYNILPLGDGALTVSFSNVLDEKTNEKVLQFFQKLTAASFPFITDIIPAYSSLTVYYDVLFLHTRNESAFDQMKETVSLFLQRAEGNKKSTGRSITIPVCYAKKFALDLEEMASQKKISVEEIIQAHTGKNYRVYMIGFLPGFPYMGKVDSRIAIPRKNSPRTSVPAGSVGIAGEQTGIYPLASPGGWNIIGRTPLKLFDSNRREPVLLQPGDNVNFVSITDDEFEDYQSRTA